MRSGIHIGRIFGIDIYLDWSWILIFILVTWNLAAGIFPSLHPEWNRGLTWGISVIASLLFFASVLAHELAHSVVAVSRGLPVRRITLYLFGGVSNIQREPESAVTEFLVSFVGPLTSILLGIFFFLLGLVLNGTQVIDIINRPNQILSGLNPISTLLFWLGPINILLGIFNLIPGFPLDGGRVLRSILWGITNNLRQATRWATIVGQVVAWAFIVAGVSMIFGLSIPFLGTGFISGLWLAFIGWFLTNAASQSYQQVVLQDMLDGIPVTRFMRSDIPTVSPNLKVSELVDQYIMHFDDRSFPVMQGDQFLGSVSVNDVRKVNRGQWNDTEVGRIMTLSQDLEVVNPKEDMAEALDAFSKDDIHQVPVVSNGHFLGTLRRQDLIRWLQLQSGPSVHPRI